MPKDVPFPNWVFIRRLEELEAEAAKVPGSKLVYTYRKALGSLRRYPLPLVNPRDALKLEGIGPFIFESLEAALREHNDRNGSRDSISAKELRRQNTPRAKSNNDSDGEGDDAELSNPSFLARPTMPKPPTAPVANKRDHSHDNNIGDGDDVFPDKPQKKRAPSTKPYLPRYQSGAFAILMGLIECEQDLALSGHPTKAELIDKAQRHCKSSFAKPSAGSQYTAWSCMATLISKDLVVRSGNPFRFSLTDAGRESAEKMREAAAKLHERTSFNGDESSDDSRAKTTNIIDDDDDDNDEVADVDAPTSKTATTRTTRALAVSSQTKDYDENLVDLTIQRSRTLPAASTSLAVAQSTEFVYHYISAEGRATLHKDEAEVRIVNDSIFCFRIQYPFSLRHHAIATTLHEQDTERPGESGLITASIPDEIGDDRVSEILSSRPPLVPSQSSSTAVSVRRMESSVGRAPSARTLSQPSGFSSSSDTEGTSSLGKRKTSSVNVDIVERALSMDINSPMPVFDVASLDERAQPRGLLSLPPSSTTDVDPETIARWASQTRQLVLEKGSFDVLLVVDNREKCDRRDNKFVQEELRRQGLIVETRPLAVGDMLWVARERHGSKREIVLGHVVERKRMDDLAASMRDGRFREQRFRLSMCNADHVIYLIEDLAGSQAEISADLPACATAMWHLQIFFQCFVKNTKSIDDTTAYLSDLTRHIESLVKIENLTAISWVPDELGAKEVRLVREHLSRTRKQRVYVTFELYSVVNAKTQPSTLREIFLRQLLTVKNIGHDAASAIVENYPTVQSLRAAYKAVTSEEQKRLLVADLTYGRVKRRKVGAAVSQTLYYVFGATAAVAAAAAASSIKKPNTSIASTPAKRPQGDQGES